MSCDLTRQLAQLVAFPTVSAESNLALLDHIEAIAAPFGARLRQFPMRRVTRQVCSSPSVRMRRGALCSAAIPMSCRPPVRPGAAIHGP